MKYLVISLFFTIFLISCQESSNKDNKQLSTAETKSAPDAEVKRYIGLLSHGSAGTFFRPCGRDSTRWAVEDATGELVAKYKSVYAYGYDNQSVMAFVDASLLGKTVEGTDNTIKIVKTDKLLQKDWDGYCMGFEFVIFGSKPFWAVEISPKEQYIDFNDEANLRYHHFKYVKPIIEGDTRTYETVSFDGKESLKIVITKSKCKDDSNPKPYPFSGQITLNGKVYNGCGQW